MRLAASLKVVEGEASPPDSGAERWEKRCRVFGNTELGGRGGRAGRPGSVVVVRRAGQEKIDLVKAIAPLTGGEVPAGGSAASAPTERESPRKRRPVAMSLNLQDRSPYRQPWRVDNRLLSDETSRASLRNRLTASIGNFSWDGLKQEWRKICSDEEKNLKHRYSGLVRATLQRIRIVERGQPTSLLMKTYANDLKLRLARLRTLTSTTACS
ncbi:hypothetical protein MRX96_011925 [Rhipicephalus microplus]